MTSTRKPSTALAWFPHVPATEVAIIDMADSRQVALRARLRNLYWLTECKPIGETTVTLIRKRMIQIDPADVMTDVQVAEVLSDHYGFVTSPEGFSIPDLMQARGVAASSIEALRVRASAGGVARAERAAAKAVAETNPKDF